MRTATNTNRTALAQWWPILPLLLVALLARVGYMPRLGYAGDLEAFARWETAMYRGSVLTFYGTTSDRLYPPISMVLLDVVAQIQGQSGRGWDVTTDPIFVVWFKVFPVVFDIFLIGICYAWLRDRKWQRWLIPGLLAISPAVISISAYWGQPDSIFITFTVATLIALNQDRPITAFLLLSLALMSKQQSAIVVPLVLVLSFRRYGWRVTAKGIGVLAVVCFVLLLPFVLGSGLSAALSPYLNAGDQYANMTNNAYNFWFIVGSLKKGSEIFLFEPGYQDFTPFLGPLTAKVFGVGLFGTYMGLILVNVWKNAGEKREFVWTAALYSAVFILPTQIHERYVYMGAVLSLIAIAQDQRMIWVALATQYVAAYNIFHTARPIRWLGINPWPSGFGLVVAFLGVMLLLEQTWIVLFYTPSLATGTQTAVPSARSRPRLPPKYVSNLLFFGSRLAAGLLLGVLGLNVLARTVDGLSAAAWMVKTVATGSRIAYSQPAALEALTLAQEVWPQARTWDVSYAANNDFGTLIGSGVHYSVIGQESNQDDLFDERLSTLAGQQALLRYESPGFLGLAPRVAVLWTFQPQVMLNAEFNGSLQLIGYTIRPNPDHISLLFHWYTEQPIDANYNLFVHVVDPLSGKLLEQADAPLGKGVHPSSTWRVGEIVFEAVDIPTQLIQAPYHIVIGLYRLDSGARAPISNIQADGQRVPSTSDSLNLVVP